MVQANFFRSRSHIPNGVKAKSWADRMEKTKKERAIKKLETEMKEEKQAEITRCVYRGPIGSPSNFKFYSRRKEITKERKKAAEERRILEEEKAKVMMEQILLERP